MSQLLPCFKNPFYLLSRDSRQKFLPALIKHEAIDETFHGNPTNGLGCDIQINYKHSDCIVYIYNQSATNFYGYLRLPWEALFKITLFDSADKPVKRTVAGEKFENWWTEEQISNWVHDEVTRYGDSKLFFSLRSNDSIQRGYFSIPQLFELKQPGKYILHFQMRLIKGNRDSSGILYFPETRLPEVIAPIQIRPEDIAPTNLVPNDQTNSLAK